MNRFVAIALLGFVAVAMAAPAPPCPIEKLAADALLEAGCPKEHLEEALGALHEFAQENCADPKTLTKEEIPDAVRECVGAFVEAFHAEHPELCDGEEEEEAEEEERCDGKRPRPTTPAARCEEEEEEEEEEERCDGKRPRPTTPAARCGAEEEIVEMAAEALLEHGCPEDHLEDALQALHEFAQEHCPHPEEIKPEEIRGAVHDCVKAFVDDFHAKHPELVEAEPEERCDGKRPRPTTPAARCEEEEEEEEDEEERCGAYGVKDEHDIEEEIINMAAESLLEHGCPEEHLEDALHALHEFAQEHCPLPQEIKPEEIRGAVHDCVKAFVDDFHAQHPELVEAEPQERCNGKRPRPTTPAARQGGQRPRPRPTTRRA